MMVLGGLTTLRWRLLPIISFLVVHSMFASSRLSLQQRTIHKGHVCLDCNHIITSSAPPASVPNNHAKTATH